MGKGEVEEGEKDFPLTPWLGLSLLCPGNSSSPPFTHPARRTSPRGRMQPVEWFSWSIEPFANSRLSRQAKALWGFHSRAPKSASRSFEIGQHLPGREPCFCHLPLPP